MVDNDVFHFEEGVPNLHSVVAGDPGETHSEGDLELGTMATVPSPHLARPLHRRTSSKSALVSDFSSGKEEVRTQFASVSFFFCSWNWNCLQTTSRLMVRFVEDSFGTFSKCAAPQRAPSTKTYYISSLSVQPQDVVTPKHTGPSYVLFNGYAYLQTRTLRGLLPQLFSDP